MNMFKWLLRCVILVVCITGTLCASMPPYLADNAIDTDAVLQHLSEDSAGLTPTEKVFDPAWVASLNERGKPTVYGKEAFEHIGMPVGGLCAGQLYLGGDGQLWFWDIFNTNDRHGKLKGEEAYEFPYKRSEPQAKGVVNLDQGFAVRLRFNGQTITRPLNRDGFLDITFQGQYPIAEVTYRDPELPVTIVLEAFSPFIPLNLDDSTYPATVMIFTLVNKSNEPVDIEIAGWLENPVCLQSRSKVSGHLHNRIVQDAQMTALVCQTQEQKSTTEPRADILFEDFENGLDRWQIEGQAFNRTGTPNHHGQPLRGYQGKKLADSYLNGGDASVGPAQSDRATGRLVSPEFNITRPYLRCLIGGGSHAGQTCLNVIIDSEVVGSLTGTNTEILETRNLDLAASTGKKAHIEIVDEYTGGWGHVLVDEIALTDRAVSITELPDYGSMTLTLLNTTRNITANTRIKPNQTVVSIFDRQTNAPATEDFGETKLTGSLSRSLHLSPGQRKETTFLLTWNFPNSQVKGNEGKYYATRFSDALGVARNISADFQRLADTTRLWRATWYDSTLPYWFLDRTFLNTSILASSTCHLFEDGRFYGFEGGNQGPGTCTHVWGYVQAMGRLFPQLERSLREKTDFSPFPNGGFHPDSGLIEFRGRFRHGLAVDGQSGVILRSYLTHQMSKDASFLKANYPFIKKAMTYLIEARDKDHDGILTGPQHNTLDANWYGKVTWLSLHYTAALRAAAAMATEIDDAEFAQHCFTLADRGRHYIETKLFNGEYFFHETDSEHPKSPGIFTGCEYSQLLGQSWAYQVGLGSILDPKKVSTALNSLWKYNFTSDVGSFRAVNKPGRWYAMTGEGGLIACTWPRGGSEVLKQGNPRFAAYNNECQNGYEYACTSLMMWHGMPWRALAHTCIMDEQRYHGSKRNPWCEVEWGVHYSRSMASYGLFTGMCGFEYHGPKRTIAFSPRLQPENFKAAFTSAEGWGTFTQKRQGNTQTERLHLRWGKLALQTLTFDIPSGKTAQDTQVTVNGVPVKSTYRMTDNRVMIELNEAAAIHADQDINIRIQY